MKHTKETWGVGDKGKTVLKTYSPTKAKILVEGVNFFNEELNKANIERIVACVNACQGITTEALEAGIVEKCVMRLINKQGVDEEAARFQGHTIMEDSDAK